MKTVSQQRSAFPPSPPPLTARISAPKLREQGSAQKRRGEETSQKLRERVSRLIEELDSDSRRMRLQAEKALLELGPVILPFLPPPELAPNAAVRDTVRRIRVQLEQQSARQSVQASRVTLQGMLSLAEILTAISRQTGNRIETVSLPASVIRQSLRVNYRQQTFWSVVQDLARRTGLRFTSTPGGDALRLQRPDESSPEELAVETSTAFRLAVVSARFRPLFGNPKERLLRVHWTLMTEPRLRPLFLKFGGRDFRVVTEDGAVLSPLDPDARYEIPAGEGASPVNLRSDFIIPKTQKITRFHLRGQLQVLTAAAQLPIVFRNLARAAGESKRRGGVTVTVQSVRFLQPKQIPDTGSQKNRKTDKEPRQTVQVGIAVSYDVGGPAFESHRLWIFHNRVFLRGEKGDPIPPQPGFTTVLQRDGAVAVVYRFSLPAGKPEKLSFVYVAPTLLIRVPVTVRLSGIPLSPPPKGTPDERH